MYILIVQIAYYMNFTSVQKKILVSLTGLFLCSFLIVHLIGNLQLLKNDEGLSFNKYAVFMTTNPVIKTMSWVLYAAILLHAFKGIYLVFKNKKARKVSYIKYKGNSNSKWYSRSMGLLGTLILIFIIVHMSDFWYEYKFGETPYSVYNQNMVTGELTRKDIPAQTDNKPIISSKMEEFVNNDARITIVKDLNRSVVLAFQHEVWIVVLYVLSMVAISFHLLHGFQSTFQTLGINNKNIATVVKFLGVWVFAILIPLGFAAIPLIIYFLQFK